MTDIKAEPSKPVKLSLKKRLIPLIFFQIYLSITILLFAFGPWPYPVKDPLHLYAYVIAGQVLLLAGYMSVVGREPRGYTGKLSPETLVLVSAVTNLLLFVPTLMLRTGGVGSILSGITSPGEAYVHYQELRNGANPIGEYVRMLFGPLLGLALPLLPFYWNRLSVWARIAGVLSIMTIAALAFAQGVNRDLIFPLALIVWMIVAGHQSGRQKLKLRTVGLVVGLTALAIAGFVVYFTRGMESRPNTAVAGVDDNVGMRADMENPMVRNMPQEVQITVMTLSGYLASGYYALGETLEMPYVPTYGLGHSMFLNRQAERWFPDSVYSDQSYPERMMREEGYNVYGLYTTAYPWIASDLTFWGALLVMFAIGRGLALSWLETLRGDNPFAVAAFAQLVILMSAFVTYLWNTNTGEGLSAFWFILLAWLWTRKRFVWKVVRS